jgi:hypothetical protein
MLFFINGFYDGDQKNKLPDPTALLKVGFLFDRVKTKTGTVKKKWSSNIETFARTDPGFERKKTRG